MATGFLQIHGSGPRNAIVGVYDRDDNFIAETESDARGFWSIASVPMEVGSYQLRAKMRTDRGGEHVSNLIDVEVTDPDADVDIAAEQLSDDDILAMEEIEAETHERASLRAGFEFRDAVFGEMVDGRDVSESELLRAIAATGEGRSEFIDAAHVERTKRKYARLVCTAAAGIALNDDDTNAVWQEYKKTETQFAADVEMAQRAASLHWQASLADETEEE